MRGVGAIAMVSALACVAEFPPPVGIGSSGIGDPGSTSAGESGVATTATTESSTTTDAITSHASDDPTGDPTNGLPDGEACTENFECASGRCYVTNTVGGVCGECNADADCEWGCSPPNPFAKPPAGSHCNGGELGGGCESSEACRAGLLCKVVVDVPGVLTFSTCGECIDQSDCNSPQLCSPDIDIADLAGAWHCIQPGSKPLGDFCDFTTTGNEECASGICGIADLMGVLQLGVCSECADPSDCAGGVCTPPMLDPDGAATAGFCR